MKPKINSNIITSLSLSLPVMSVNTEQASIYTHTRFKIKGLEHATIVLRV